MRKYQAEEDWDQKEGLGRVSELRDAINAYPAKYTSCSSILRKVEVVSESHDQERQRSRCPGEAWVSELLLILGEGHWKGLGQNCIRISVSLVQ